MVGVSFQQALFLHARSRAPVRHFICQSVLDDGLCVSIRKLISDWWRCQCDMTCDLHSNSEFLFRFLPCHFDVQCSGFFCLLRSCRWNANGKRERKRKSTMNGVCCTIEVARITTTTMMMAAVWRCSHSQCICIYDPMPSFYVFARHVCTNTLTTELLATTSPSIVFNLPAAQRRRRHNRFNRTILIRFNRKDEESERQRIERKKNGTEKTLKIRVIDNVVAQWSNNEIGWEINRPWPDQKWMANW